MSDEDVFEHKSLLRSNEADFRRYETDITKTKGGINLSKEKLLVVICILLCELCERLTYYSVVANLVLYCTSTLKLPSSDASTVYNVFSGTVYIIPVTGGYISDTYAGKYNTILGSGLIYLLGLFLLPASAVDYTEWFDTDDNGKQYDLSINMRKTYFFLGLVFVGIGTGGIKANVGPFGAQQVDDLGPKAVQSFFNWFYWFINAGSFIAYLGVASIQQNVSFALGYLIPLLSMIISLVIFVAVRSKYVHTQPGGSILEDSIGVCCSTRCKGFNTSRKSHGGPYDDEMVNGVISVLRVIPIFILVIPFWAIYAQSRDPIVLLCHMVVMTILIVLETYKSWMSMQSTFFLQGERMDVAIGNAQVPVAGLSVFNTIIIMLTIPIMDKVVYPQLEKYGKSPSQLQRIAIGFILSGLSVVVAGIVEIYRKDDIAKNGYIPQELADENFNASRISVFAQVPQFALVGAGEVFTSISGLEFAYSQAPDFMQGLVMGLFLMTSGLGNYLSEIILNIVKSATGSTAKNSWYPDELNDGKTENLFFLLAGLMALNFIIFVIVSKCYKYKKDTENDLDIDENLEKSQNVCNPLYQEPS